MPGKRRSTSALAERPPEPQLDLDYVTRVRDAITTEGAAGASRLRAEDPERFDLACSDLLDELARHDIHWLGQRVLTDDRGEHIVARPIDRLIQGFIDRCVAEGKYAGILAPVGSGKTAQVTILRPLFEVAKDPNRIVKIVCGKDDAALKRLKTIGQILDLSADWRRIHGHRIRPSPPSARSAEPWNAHKLTVEREVFNPEPTFEACGVEGSHAGARCHWMIFDDAIAQRATMLSPALRETVHEKVHNEFLTRVYLDDHMVVWICTRWTEDDESGVLMQSPAWWFLTIRVSEDYECLTWEISERGRIFEQGTCPLPPRWNAKLLQRVAAVLGQLNFDRQYRQRAFTARDLYFQHWEQTHVPAMSFGAAAGRAVRENLPCYIGVDPGTKKRPGNAIVTLALDGQKRIPVDARIGAWGGAEIAEQLSDLWRRFRPLAIIVEDNVALYFADLVRANPDRFPWSTAVQPLTTTHAGKTHPELGLKAMDLEFEQGLWQVPAAQKEEHDHLSPEHYRECGECLLLIEMRLYPTWPTSDLVMATWLARCGLMTYDPTVAALEQRLAGLVPEDPFFTGLDDPGMPTYDRYGRVT